MINNKVVSKIFTKVANTNGYQLCPRFFRAVEKLFKEFGVNFQCAATSNTSCIAYVAQTKYYIYYNHTTKRYVSEGKM